MVFGCGFPGDVTLSPVNVVHVESMVFIAVVEWGAGGGWFIAAGELAFHGVSFLCGVNCIPLEYITNVIPYCLLTQL